MNKLPISAIVVVKNGEKTLVDCLKSLQRNNPAEIIVIDGKSTDRTLEIARAYTERLYSDDGKGVSFAHQPGLEQASQSYIAFIDADILLPEGALETMLDELKVGNYTNLQAQVRNTSQDSYFARGAETHVRMILNRIQGGLSACVMDKKSALKTGFDPSIYLAGDDIDFMYRLKRAGYKVGISSVVAEHEHQADFRSFVRQKFWYGRSKPALIRKHGPWKGDLWAPAVMAYWLGFCLIRGKLNLIPFFLVGGVVETAGMAKGFFEFRKNHPRRNV